MTLDELSAELADLTKTVEKLAVQVAANGETAKQVAELLQVLREQKPAAAPVVNIPAAPRPQVTVQAPVVNLPPLTDCEVIHQWGMEMGHFVPLRSIVIRKVPNVG